MTDVPEVKSLGNGKYSFIVGKLTYTMTTRLKEEDFTKLVADVRSLVAEYPPYLNQDERLIMALMSVFHRLDALQGSLDELIRNALKEAAGD